MKKQGLTIKFSTTDSISLPYVYCDFMLPTGEKVQFSQQIHDMGTRQMIVATMSKAIKKAAPQLVPAKPKPVKPKAKPKPVKPKAKPKTVKKKASKKK